MGIFLASSFLGLGLFLPTQTHAQEASYWYCFDGDGNWSESAQGQACTAPFDRFPQAQERLSELQSETTYLCYDGDGRTQSVAQGASCPEGYTAGGSQAVERTADTPPPDSGGSDFWTWLAEQLSNIVYVFTVGLGSLVAYVAAYMLNLAIYISLNSTAYAMQFVTDAWTSVRDIANIGFIFILIFIAVKLMLQAEDRGTMQTLSRVIIFALIINFSFFFARVVIDGGNILAVNFYNQIEAPALDQQTGTSGLSSTVVSTLTGGSQNSKDLTAGIMGAINVQKLIGSDSFEKFSNSNLGFSGFLTKLIALSFIYICVGVIFGLLAAMFFTIALKFIARVVILWLVIISAPLAMLLAALPQSFPQARSLFKQWINALVVYSLYPAIFLFLYFIISNFAQGLATPNPNINCVSASVLEAALCDVTNSTATGVAYLAGLVGSIGIRLGFIMVLLYFALKASDMVSKMGGRFAEQVTSRTGLDKLGERLSGFSRRATSWQGRAAAYPITAPAGMVARFPGAGAALVDSRLKNAKWANSNKWWNPLSATARGVQKGVLQPLQGTSILGAKSYKDNKEAWKKEMDERGANRASRETNDIAKQAAKDIEAGKTPDQATLDKLNNLSESRMKDLNANTIKTLSKVFTENTMKVVDKLNHISEFDKETARKNFNEHSPNSPVGIAKKQLDLLRNINKDLSASYKLAKVESTIGPHDNKKTGVEINKDVIQLMVEGDPSQQGEGGVKKLISKIDSEIAQKRGQDTTIERQTKNLLQKADKALEKLADETKNIRAGVGGYPEPGKFKS